MGSKRWKLNLNGTKSEVAYFTNYKKEYSWIPEIKIDGKQIGHTDTPRLLVVTLDKSLTFDLYSTNVNKAASDSSKIIKLFHHVECMAQIGNDIPKDLLWKWFP